MGFAMSIDKTEARKTAFARRKAAFGIGLDADAQTALRSALAPHRGKTLSGFMPIRTEISPLPVMASWEGPVGVPVIVGNGQPLEFHRWIEDCEMVDGPFGAMVPANAEAVVPEVLIVPLLAFDANGNRLGYGGGFYDRTLELLRRQRDTVAIGYAYSVQQLDSLPLEPTDQPLNAIVTEKGVVQFG